MPFRVVRPIARTGGVYAWDSLPSLVPCSSNTTYEAAPGTVDTGASLSRFLEPTLSYVSGVVEQRAYAHFDEAQDGAALKAVALQAIPRWLNDGSGSPGSHSGLTITNELWLMDVDWTPAALTWSNQPALSGIKAAITLETDTLDESGDLFCNTVLWIPVPPGTWYGLAAKVSTNTPPGANDSARLHFSGLDLRALVLQ